LRHKAEWAALEAKTAQLENSLSLGKVEIAQAQGQVLQLTSSLATARANLANADLRLENNAREIEVLQTRLKTEFENLANRILEEKSTRFTAQNQTNLDQVLGPLKTQIHEFKQRIEQVYSNETADRAALRTQIESLRALNTQVTEEARNLTLALKGDSKAQGNWGELILERVLERSGLTRGVEFTVQTTLKSEEGSNLRPDVIIHLPENKHLVIDSKVSLTAYERCFSAVDSETQEAALREHVQSVRKHVEELASKKYQDLYQISAPDFVFMFLPVEPAFTRALQADSSLFNEAFEKKVILVTPSTLLATLRTVAHIWKQEKQTRHALDIAKKSGALYDKFVGLYEDLTDLGDKLKSASDCHRDALNKLREGPGNLIKRVEDIKRLGAKAGKSLPSQLVEEAEEESTVAGLQEEGENTA
jgi:DNA recombination protein RmuC